MDELFHRWFGGDEEAVRFAAQLWTASQEWDDLEDEGRCADMNALLHWLAFGKEYEPFFARHSGVLRPVMLSMYLQWRAANVLDHEPEHIAKAFMLRAALYQVWHVMAWLTGGHDWAAEVGPEIYRSYGETLAGLTEEMTHA